MSALSKPVCESSKTGTYANERDANEALDRIAAENAGYAIPVRYPTRAYECRCGAWHLTCEPKRNQRRRRRHRHLFVAPEQIAAPEPHPAPMSYAPTDPISPERELMWKRLQRENGARNLSNPWPWRQAA